MTKEDFNKRFMSYRDYLEGRDDSFFWAPIRNMFPEPEAVQIACAAAKMSACVYDIFIYKENGSYKAKLYHSNEVFILFAKSWVTMDEVKDFLWKFLTECELYVLPRYKVSEIS